LQHTCIQVEHLEQVEHTEEHLPTARDLPYMPTVNTLAFQYAAGNRGRPQIT